MIYDSKASHDETLPPQVQDEIKQMDTNYARNWVRVSVTPNTNQPMHDMLENKLTPYDHISIENDDPYDDEAVKQEVDLYPDEEAYNKYITSQVLLPRGDTFEKATVLRRKRDHEGNLIGKSHNNPILDSSVYEVIFSDGHTAEYATNMIAENIYTMIDKEGNELAIFKVIIGQRQDDSVAIQPQHAWTVSHNGNRVPIRTTKVWDLCIEWQDNSTSWTPLKDLRISNRIEVDEPAFRWWIYDTLKRRDQMIMASRTRYIKCMHKFGIRLPKTVEEALEIDKETSTTLWHDAIKKEMKNNAIAFEFLNPGDTIPICYKKITLHMVFNIKMDFMCKAQLVAGRHLTKVPSHLAYSSVVSRESVRIMFLLAALNDLNILSADIGNAYLYTPNREKVYAIAGKEFGSRAGETVVIVRALYGLKSAGAAW